MEVLWTIINAVVIAAIGGLLSWQMRGQLVFFEKRMDGFEKRLDSFQGSLEAMRSDLTQVALAVGARPRAEEA